MNPKRLLLTAWILSSVVAGFVNAREPLTPTDISKLIERARQTLTGQPAYLDHIRTVAPFTELNEDEVKAALAEVKHTVQDPEQKGGIYMVLLNRWAELNGEAAMSFVKTILKPEIEFDSGLRATVFTTWALREPDAAWRWYQQNAHEMGDERISSIMLAAYFRVLASRDVEQAIAKLEAVKKADRPKMLNSIAYSVGSDPARLLLLEKIATLSPEEQLEVRKIVVTHWTIRGWHSAEKWINSLPTEERKPLQKAAGDVLIHRKPELAAELLLKIADEKEKPAVYGRIAAGWAQVDLPGLDEWLKKQPQGPQLDLARHYIISVLQTKDPAAAFARANSLQENAQRSREVMTVFLQWREKDSASAEAALDASGLPPDEISRLKKNPRFTKP